MKLLIYSLLFGLYINLYVLSCR